VSTVSWRPPGDVLAVTRSLLVAPVICSEGWKSLRNKPGADALDPYAEQPSQGVGRGPKLVKTLRDGMLLVVVVAGSGFGVQGSGSALPIVRAHKSDYVIYYDIRAATSVAEAAADLRDYIQRATGALLPIVNAAPKSASPFIALGQTGELRTAGISTDSMAADAFVIAPRGRNVFIAGPDSARGEKLDSGGTSSGTANGVYAFLERYLDVRWLIPGEAGADVPNRPDVVVPAVDVSEAPVFASRRVPYMQNENAAVAQWSRRQKLGASLALNHGHNWEIIGPEMFDTHPDWFATGQRARLAPGTRYKLETTNPGLVAAFAARAIDAFRRDRTLRSFSLSPSDSAGWSESPASKALYDTDPHGALSVTPLILKFYNDVARIVGREFPDRLLCGYIYAQYLYPPTAGLPAMEPNVCLVVAASTDYGYQWFRPAVRQELMTLLATWGQAAKTTAYYDLPSALTQTLSAPTPASARILSFVFSHAASSGMQGVYIYGVPDWGYGAATNYVMARLAWSPHADADALAAEFYRRAYGPASGTVMKQLNDRLEAALDRFYVSHPKVNYSLTPEMLRDVYALSYPDIERSYQQALERCSEPAARSRLEMFGRTLILLRWNLRRERLIPDTSSAFARTDVQLRQLLTEWATDLATAPATRAAATARLDGKTPSDPH
jgi:hypothetical protein